MAGRKHCTPSAACSEKYNGYKECAAVSFVASVIKQVLRQWRSRVFVDRRRQRRSYKVGPDAVFQRRPILHGICAVVVEKRTLFDAVFAFLLDDFS